jgi:hypothetical protein
MRTEFKRKFVVTAILSLLLTSACNINDILTEEPRNLTPDFFRTSQGLNSAITAAYATFRNYYGSLGGWNVNIQGTDEFTHGQQAVNPPLNLYDATLDPRNGDIGLAWGRSYPAINTCNGVIELGPDAVDLTEVQRNQLIAEAKFIRANWYFILVTQYGGASLDLGSGPLKFNQNSSNIASRATSAEVYEAIINDLESITDGANSDDLPDAKPAAAGHAWKASALHLLSKAYLTRAWSSDAVSGDFQKAYDRAMELINNQSKYGVGLRPTFSDIFREGNEYNSETLWTVNWIDNTTFNNNTGFGGPNYQNIGNYVFRCFYHDNTPGLIRDAANGRPWVRYTPTRYLLNTAFADKINDVRYNASFQTVWYVNSATTNNPKALAVGDTAIWMVPEHRAASVLPTVNSRRYVMFLPDAATSSTSYFGVSRPDYDGYFKQNRYYPSLSKFNATQPRPGGDPNISSVRPIMVYRLGETYLLAAEAAHKLGDNDEAANLINVIRSRAAASAGAIPTMTANTLDNLNAAGVDYILEERSRELAGEHVRWVDLVRTGKLIERVNLYNNYPARPGVPIPNPQPHHVRRPIPQGQIDSSVDPTTDDGKYPQNPGY